MLQQFYKVSNTEAVTILGLPFTVSAGASPLFGFAVDLLGRNLIWMLASTALQTFVHIGILFLHMDVVLAWVLNVLMGIMYSMFAACLWPSIAVVVPMRYQGSAYGLSFALQNLGLAAFPLIIGTDFLVPTILEALSYLFIQVELLNWKEIPTQGQNTFLSAVQPLPSSSLLSYSLSI